MASRFSSEGKYAIRAVIARLDLGKDGNESRAAADDGSSVIVGIRRELRFQG